MFAAGMDTATIEKLGFEPIKSGLFKIAFKFSSFDFVLKRVILIPFSCATAICSLVIRVVEIVIPNKFIFSAIANPSSNEVG